jgi:hypothetical protein
MNGYECLNPEKQVFLMKLNWGTREVHTLMTTSCMQCSHSRRLIETCNLQQKRGLLSKTVLLHHDSACPHTVVTAIQTIQNFKFGVLPHPPCSPDLALCHFYALGPLKEALCGCWLGSDEVKLALRTWIWKQPKTCFSDEIRQLMD